MACKRSKTSSLSLSSAEIIGGNNDILTEVLVYLPTKSLIRFQSVNKQWQSILSSDSFFDRHNHHHRGCHVSQTPSFILQSVSCKKNFYYNPTTKGSSVPMLISNTRILQSSHGLLLLESTNNPPRHKREYYVYNPATRRSRNLCLLEHNMPHGISLAYDPSKSPHYKVICATVHTEYATYSSICTFQVYDSRTHTWKDLGATLYKGVSSFYKSAYFNNQIYWIGPPRYRRGYLNPQNQILHLDLKRGIISPCRNMIDAGGACKKFLIKSNNGRLNCVCMHFSPTTQKKSLVVLEMLDDSSGWFEKYSAVLSPSQAALLYLADDQLNVVGISNSVGDGDQEECSVWIYVPSKVISYRFYGGKFQVFDHLKTADVTGACYQFMESLASV